MNSGMGKKYRHDANSSAYLLLKEYPMASFGYQISLLIYLSSASNQSSSIIMQDYVKISF
jgi:hypothetical protein